MLFGPHVIFLFLLATPQVATEKISMLAKWRCYDTTMKQSERKGKK